MSTEWSALGYNYSATSTCMICSERQHRKPHSQNIIMVHGSTEVLWIPYYLNFQKHTESSVERAQKSRAANNIWSTAIIKLFYLTIACELCVLLTCTASIIDENRRSHSGIKKEKSLKQSMEKGRSRSEMIKWDKYTIT